MRNIGTCADLYASLADQLCTSRDEIDRYEAAISEVIPDVDYKAAVGRKHIKKKVHNEEDRNITEIYLNSRNKFRRPPFKQLLTNVKLR